ncbi:hypothetical protein [Shewanella algae]|uniref:hypothetical protein n=1 Tax=Shewanella algae TaxID=38313 RepID=UPI001181D58A|nr:hypothetical protein [Shewanella algae]TVL37870.1 hypothetical protein AYI94_08840 [Shewanella algae]HEW9973158.1 hypothetical protein [Shewanella algae]
MFRGLNEIKQHIEEGNLDYLRQHMPKAWSQYMFRIEKDPAWLEIISYLRANAVIKDYQIYYLMYCRVAYYSEPKQFTPLFDIIKVNGPDGSLVEDDPEHLYRLCHDVYLGFISAFISVGGRLDHNRLLELVFAGESDAYAIFNFLLPRNAFSHKALATAAACLFYNEYHLNGAGEQALAALLSRGIALDYCFDDDSEFGEYACLAALIFGHNPKRFNQLYADGVEQALVDGFDWSFLLTEHELTLEHIEALKLLSSSAALPIDEIGECLLEREDEALLAAFDSLR